MEYGVFLLFYALAAPLSASSVFRLGRILGAAVYCLSRKRRRIAEINLDIAFAQTKSRRERQRIIRNSFIQQGVTLLQCLWLHHKPAERIGEIIEKDPEGLDVFKNCLLRKKGVFFLMAHYGNWEAMGISHGFLGISPLNSIVRKLDNPFFEKKVAAFRALSGNAVLYKDQPSLKMVRKVKNNGCVVIMMDQNTARGGLFVDFFGEKAATARSLALLSLATGAAIVPMFSYPTQGGKYKIKYGPEIKFEPTGDRKSDIFNLTQKCEHFLESVIREYPEPWMWTHRRWKTRPPGEENTRLYP